jgi:hypothetical protein
VDQTREIVITENPEFSKDLALLQGLAVHNNPRNSTLR